MSRPNTSLNFKGMNSELHAADAAVDPLLVAAKIITIKVDGKDVAASDAPLPVKISALGELLKTGDSTQDTAQLQDANGQLAGQVKDLEVKLTLEKATTSAQAQKTNELTGKLNIAESSVITLTAQLLESGRLLKASTNEGIRVTGLLTAQKLMLARKCQSCDAVKFNGADGNPLKADCSDADLGLSCKEMTFDSLVSAYSGALHAAAGKLGIVLSAVPVTGTHASVAKKKTATELCLEDVIAAKKAGTWKGPGE